MKIWKRKIMELLLVVCPPNLLVLTWLVMQNPIFAQGEKMFFFGLSKNNTQQRRDNTALRKHQHSMNRLEQSFTSCMHVEFLSFFLYLNFYVVLFRSREKPSFFFQSKSESACLPLTCLGSGHIF